MDFALSAEQSLLQETVRSFVSKEFGRDVVRAAERDHVFPRPLFGRLAELGVLDIAVSSECGESCALDQLIVTRELARGFAGMAVAFVNTACLGGAVISAHSTAHRQRLVEELAAGRLLLAFAWTEPHAGSDVLALRTSAAVNGDGNYVINGNKTFITLAKEADYLLTIVRTDVGAVSRSAGLTCLLVPASTAGLHITEIPKVGQRTTPFYDVSFVDVVVPRDCRIGDEGLAWKQLLPSLGAERILFSGICLGLAEAAFESARDYCLTREAFGKTIAHFQAVQHKLVEMKTAIDTAELLAYRAAWELDTHGGTVAGPTQSLMVAADAAASVTDSALQLLGASGYTTEFDVERYWRDARAFQLSPVSTEVAKNVLARSLGLPRSS